MLSSIGDRVFSMTILVLIAVLWASPILCGSQYDNNPTDKPTDNQYDVIIFAATPAGIAAALAAKAAGAQKVLLLEPTAHVGGMASPGVIGLCDSSNNEIRTNNATQYQWAMRYAKFYELTILCGSLTTGLENNHF